MFNVLLLQPFRKFVPLIYTRESVRRACKQKSEMSNYLKNN